MMNRLYLRTVEKSKDVLEDLKLIENNGFAEIKRAIENKPENTKGEDETAIDGNLLKSIEEETFDIIGEHNKFLKENFKKLDPSKKWYLKSGATEAGVKNDSSTGSKFMVEMFYELPRTLKDMLDNLLEEVNYDQSVMIQIDRLTHYISRVSKNPSASPSIASINCLLFADEVALIAAPDQLQHLLDLAEQYSLLFGYRLSLSKCAILAHPSTDSTNLTYSLYNTPITTSHSFKYLGVYFNYKGMDSQLFITNTAAKVQKSMHRIHQIGARTSGFSVPLSIRIYKQFIRLQIEYGLCITSLKATNHAALERIQDDCLRLIVGGFKNSSMKALRVIVNLPSMIGRCMSRNHLLLCPAIPNIYWEFIQRAHVNDVHPIDAIIKQLPTRPPTIIAQKQAPINHWQSLWTNLHNILFTVDQICHKQQEEFVAKPNMGQLFYQWLSE
ncbi:MAG: hypothetical protein EXX96DRAFT_606832 [Benjaminiella poitrasii]|nr:MAG: hypothetical protein EXX96DRAFT_606832 [Benjaminiella poitrasii]